MPDPQSEPDPWPASLAAKMPWVDAADVQRRSRIGFTATREMFRQTFYRHKRTGARLGSVAVSLEPIDDRTEPCGCSTKLIEHHGIMGHRNTCTAVTFPTVTVTRRTRVRRDPRTGARR